MPRVFHNDDAPLAPLRDRRVAVIGYGNQGRSWALNLRDSGVDVVVGTVGDDSRARAADEGFPAHEIPEAVAGADVSCLLFPDEVMREVVPASIAPNLEPGDAVCFASGYAIAFDEVGIPEGVDVLMVAPRMLGVGVRESYVDGSGFVAFAGVDRDATGAAWALCLALARGIGATRRGALELGARQEALLDLFVEQGIAPALTKVWRDAALALIASGIPLEAILVEFFLSGEVERTYRALRELGYSRQQMLHSATSRYGTLSRAERFADLDAGPQMRQVLEEITSGEFAREWEAERDAGYPRLRALTEADERGLLTGYEDGVRAMFEARD